MSLLDSLFGSTESAPQDQVAPEKPTLETAPLDVREYNGETIARYQFMIKVIGAQELEIVHEEAFAALSAEDRDLVSHQLNEILPPSTTEGLTEAPRSLAQTLTKVEIDQPGSIERLFGGANLTGVPGSVGAPSLLDKLALGAIESSPAAKFFDNPSIEEAFLNSPEYQGMQLGVTDYLGRDHQNENPEVSDASALPRYGEANFGISNMSGNF